MKRTSVVISALSALIFGSAVLAQAPLSQIDAHIATAKTAAGQEYRGTFVNLCLPSAPRGGGAGRGGAAGGAGAARGAGAPQTPDARLVAQVQGVRQLTGRPRSILWGAQTSAGFSSSNEFRLGDRRNHRRDDETRLESKRNNTDHQPRAGVIPIQGAAEMQGGGKRGYSAKGRRARHGATLKSPPRAAGPGGGTSVGREKIKLAINTVRFSLPRRAPTHRYGRIRAATGPDSEEGARARARWDEYIARQGS